MEAQPDFKEPLELLNGHSVDYLTVGAHSLAFHGVPRYSPDLALLVHPTLANGVRIVAALASFGFGSLGLRPEDLATEDQVVQLGVAPVRVDLLTSLTGVSWAQAFSGSCSGGFGGVPVRYLGRRELLANKRALGRTQDIADIEALGE